MSPMNAAILSLDRVTVQFGALRAVDAVTLSVAPGERRAMIGSNGAGKTTLFNTIAGTAKPAAGRILFQGVDITRLAPHRRAHIGISRTFQITNLFPRLSVEDNARLALRGLSWTKFSFLPWTGSHAGENARLADVIEIARLGHRRSALVAELSYGEQRQLELAMALASGPRLLLLDEPAAGLSPVERGRFSEIVRTLPRDLTIILVEHDIDLALGLVDWVTCLYDGKILAEDTPDAIRGNAAVQEVYLGKARHHA